MTTRYNETGLDSLWSTMHEAGHGLYAHGISPSLERTPLATERALAQLRGAQWAATVQLEIGRAHV